MLDGMDTISKSARRHLNIGVADPGELHRLVEADLGRAVKPATLRWYAQRHRAELAGRGSTYDGADRLRRWAEDNPERAREADRRNAKRRLGERYVSDPDFRLRVLEKSRRSRIRNCPYQVFKATRGNAHARGLRFELTRAEVEEMLAPMACSATGLPLAAEWDGAGRNPWWPSLDQIEPRGGYLPGNVRVVCWAYNVMRGELADDVVASFARVLVRGALEPDHGAAERLATWRMGHVTAPAYLLSRWRRSASDRGLTFDISRGWLDGRLARGSCEVTGIALGMDYDGRASRNPLIPSLDRIDAGGGYTEDNVRLVCGWYNYARQDWPDDLVLRVASALV